MLAMRASRPSVGAFNPVMLGEISSGTYDLLGVTHRRGKLAEPHAQSL